MKYFTADLHLNGVDQLGSYCRPFKDVDDMNMSIINNINSICKKDDDLYVVGDLISYSYRNKTGWKNVSDLIRMIKPHIHLVLGNNEEALYKEQFAGCFEKFTAFYIDCGIDDIYLDNSFVKTESVCYNLVHSPLKCSRKHLNLYGHIHMGAKVGTGGINVGVDVTNFRPVSEQYIYQMCHNVANYYVKEHASPLYTPIDDLVIFHRYYNALKPLYEGIGCAV